uniref:Uncharacterized protein n=1 Tax=Rhizophora mucronata TaxID=61149 RepID=A0A2P2IN32_RHIMU
MEKGGQAMRRERVKLGGNHETQTCLSLTATQRRLSPRPQEPTKPDTDC